VSRALRQLARFSSVYTFALRSAQREASVFDSLCIATTQVHDESNVAPLILQVIQNAARYKLPGHSNVLHYVENCSKVSVVQAGKIIMWSIIASLNYVSLIKQSIFFLIFPTLE
jgi:hypothetical protein